MSLAPLPWGGVGGGCQAPSLWEGWGGLLFVYRIIYPHTLCRRIAYPPEQMRPERGQYTRDKYGPRSSLLAFKTKWRKKGQQSVSPRHRLGGTDVSRLRPAGAKSFSLPSLGLCAVILLPLQGVFTVAPLSAGRCPGLTYRCPFGALNLNW